MVKAPDAFRTISEVSEALDTPAHVLRFWESKFNQIKPVKRAGGRRYYRPDDIALLAGIKFVLHEQGMTIKGAQKLLRENGVKHVAGLVGSPIQNIDLDSPEPRKEMPKIRIVSRQLDSLDTQLDDDKEQPSLFVSEEAKSASFSSAELVNLTVTDENAVATARFFDPSQAVDEEAIIRNAKKIAPLIARLETVRDRMRAS